MYHNQGEICKKIVQFVLAPLLKSIELGLTLFTVISREILLFVTLVMILDQLVICLEDYVTQILQKEKRLIFSIGI
ncbi:hypothetical protein [Neobacillus muris]|uniref:hypothetical protein n=1 Tax=Neobacillus muris TaxID=2941334 RepID=UPI00203BA4BA|nr:hypothetical protein [Neobacillus muris]